MRASEAVTRRELLHGTAAIIGGACLCEMLNADSDPRATCCDTPAIEPGSITIGENTIVIDLARAESLSQVGGAARIIHEERKMDILVIRSEKKRYVAVDGKCSHAGRPLNYVRSRNLIQCVNFGHATFELSGRHIRGPEVRRDLRAYSLTVAGNKLAIAI